MAEAVRSRMLAEVEARATFCQVFSVVRSFRLLSPDHTLLRHMVVVIAKAAGYSCNPAVVMEALEVGSRHILLVAWGDEIS